jgi:hypothetical protein
MDMNNRGAGIETALCLSCNFGRSPWYVRVLLTPARAIQARFDDDFVHSESLRTAFVLLLLGGGRQQNRTGCACRFPVPSAAQVWHSCSKAVNLIYKKYMGEEGMKIPAAQQSINAPRVILKITPKRIESLDTTR